VCGEGASAARGSGARGYKGAAPLGLAGPGVSTPFIAWAARACMNNFEALISGRITSHLLHPPNFIAHILLLLAGDVTAAGPASLPHICFLLVGE
jgi:hypothetical protein